MTIAPYGSWASSIGIELLVAGVVTLREPALGGRDVYWIEGRPSEGGRQVVVRRSPDGTTTDATPAGVNVRDRVQEYGGAPYVIDGDTVIYSNWADGRLWAIAPGERRAADHARRLVPLRRRGGGRCAGAPDLRSRGPLGARRSGQHDRRSSARRRRPGRGAARRAGRSTARPDSRRTGAASRGSAGITRTCRGTARTCGWRRSTAPGGQFGPSTSRAARRSGRPSRGGRPTASCISSTSGTAGCSCYRRVGGRDELLTPIEAEFAGPDWQFGMTLLRLRRRRQDPRGGPERWSRSALVDRPGRTDDDADRAVRHRDLVPGVRRRADRPQRRRPAAVHVPGRSGRRLGDVNRAPGRVPGAP